MRSINLKLNPTPLLTTLNKNKSLLFSFLSILSGVLTGACVYNLSDSPVRKELLSDFISLNAQFRDKTNPEIFSGIFIGGLIFFSGMFILGGSFLGKELSFFASAVKFSGIGAMISHLYREYGAEGFEYVLLVFMPGKIIFIFAALLITKICFDTSDKLRCGLCGADASALTKAYGLKCLTAFLIMSASYIVDFVCLKLFSGLVSF